MDGAEALIDASEASAVTVNAPQAGMDHLVKQDAPEQEIDPAAPQRKPSAKKGMKQTKTPTHWQEVGAYFNSFHKKKEAGQKAHDMYGREIWGPLKGDAQHESELHDPYIGYESRMRQIRRWAKRAEKIESNREELLNGGEEREGPIQQLLGEVSAEGERLAAGGHVYQDNLGLERESSMLGRRNADEDSPSASAKRPRN